MPQSPSIQRNAALVDPFVGEFRNGIDFEAGAVSMRANDLEPCVIGVELLTNIESDDGGIVPGEEVLVAGFQGPVVDLS